MAPSLEAMCKKALRGHIIIFLHLSRAFVDSGFLSTVGIGLSYPAAAFAFAFASAAQGAAAAAAPVEATAMMMIVAATVAQSQAHQARRRHCRCRGGFQHLPQVSPLGKAGAQACPCFTDVGIGKKEGGGGAQLLLLVVAVRMAESL